MKVWYEYYSNIVKKYQSEQQNEKHFFKLEKIILKTKSRSYL